MAPDDRGATQPRKSPSINEQSAIDQWRHTSTPAIQQGAPGDKTAGADTRSQPHTPKETSTEQSDKSTMDARAPGMTPMETPPSDTRLTSASTPPSQQPLSSSQQTAETVKGPTSSSRGITGDIAMAGESATPAAPLQAPASDGRSTALQGGIPDARGGNAAVKASPADPRVCLLRQREAFVNPHKTIHHIAYY